jgi:cytoskeleton protein RodZ
MSAHPPPGQEDENTTDLMDSPGRRLRATRKARGLELDRIAAELHLSPATIELLEQDDYEALPGDVFIVGYIRKYARVVALDPEPLLVAYRQAMPKATRTWLRPNAAPHSGSQVGSGHLLGRLAGFGVPILLAVLVFAWWQDQRPGEAVDTGSMGTHQESNPAERPDMDAMQQTATDGAIAPAAPQPDAAQTATQEPPEPASPPQPASPDQQQSTPSTAEDLRTAEPTATDIPETTEYTATSTDDAAPAADVDAGTQAGEILMTFDGPCWVDVRDSERKYKLFGEMKKGDRRVLEGTPPYSIILGNAAAVTITVDGAAFDLSTISQGNVARFTLDPSTSP